MAAAEIAITGSTGFVGGHAARLLAEAGIPLRLIVRDVARAPQLAGAEAVGAEYGDGAASHKALAGVKSLFMVSGQENEHRAEQHSAFIQAAADAGVQHIVYTSFVAAGSGSTFTLGRDHGRAEDEIRASGMRFTFLRDNLYSDFIPFMAGEDGVIRGPAGSGAGAFVARVDVARMAAAVLQDPTSHENATYDLTGPAALTLDEAAAVMSRISGREYRFHDETLEEAYRSREVFGAPEWQVDAWVSTYTAIAGGDLAAVSEDIQRVTGRAARSFEEQIAEWDAANRAG